MGYIPRQWSEFLNAFFRSQLNLTYRVRDVVAIACSSATLGYVKNRPKLTCISQLVKNLDFGFVFLQTHENPQRTMKPPHWTPLLSFVFLIYRTSATELTFELPDSAKECFHQEIKKNTTATLEFQVVTGGQYDVDVMLEDPTGAVIYKQIKLQFDSHTFTAQHHGIYKVCFSNEFSTFSHKLVYMDFQVGDEQPLPGLGEHVTALTQMESSAQDIHKALTTILDYQTHHRLREAQGRKRAEDLNERVLWWSIMETIAVITIALGQVFVLRNFFTERKPFNIK